MLQAATASLFDTEDLDRRPIQVLLGQKAVLLLPAPELSMLTDQNR